MSEWRTTTIGSLVEEGILEFGDGYRTKRPELGTPGIPILRVAEVLDGKISPSFADYVHESHTKKMGRKISQGQDIVLTTKGTVGRTAIIPNDSPNFVYSPQVCYFRLSGSCRLDRGYLYYWFKSDQFWSQASSLMSQTDMAAYLNLSDIRSLRLAVPNIDTQKKISKALGALDDKIAANEHIARTAAELATSLFSLHTSSFSKIPLAHIATPVLGSTPDRDESEYWGGDTLWASAKDVAKSESGVLIDTEEKITHSATENTRVKTVPAGSVIITARGTVGAVARTIKAATLNQSCYAFIPGNITRSVLYEIVLMASRESINVSHGTVFSTLNMKSFEHLLIPSMDKTQALLIEQEIYPLHRSVEGALQESRKLAELRDTLLPQLMSGKLRVKDAEKIVEDNV